MVPEMGILDILGTYSSTVSCFMLASRFGHNVMMEPVETVDRRNGSAVYRLAEDYDCDYARVINSTAPDRPQCSL